MLGIPCGTRSLEPTILNAIANLNANEGIDVSIAVSVASSLTWNFNDLWCKALNGRKTYGITHFAMLHSDIVPEDNQWLAKLYQILVDSGKQIVSAAMPIKDNRGLTSVAFDTHPWRPLRLTMQDLAELPETFDNDTMRRHGGFIGDRSQLQIIFNTGLWIADVRQLWADNVVFDIRNDIRLDANGIYHAEFEPEDWLFSRWCNLHDVPYAVTKAIKAKHVGSFSFPNYGTWGTDKHDTDNMPHSTVVPREETPQH